MKDNSFVLLLRELEHHPNSYLLRLINSMEKPSVIYPRGKESLKSYNTSPMLDDKYLVIFERVPLFKHNLAHIKFKFIFPVVLCRTGSQLNEAESICKSKSIPYKTYHNDFTREDAWQLVVNLASEEVSDSFVKALVRHVGLSPLRIIGAMSTCENVGYKVPNIAKYVDKYRYVDALDVIEALLGIAPSKAAIRRAALYIHSNRRWYTKYTRKTLVNEVSLLLNIYYNLLDGNLNESQTTDYIENNNLSRYKVLYAINLFEHVSLTQLFALGEFLKSASLMEVALRISKR